MAGGERALDQHVDDVAVLGVHADRAAVLARPQQRLEDAPIVEHEDAAIRHEQLERCNALADQRVHLAFHLIVHVRHDHVEAIVDDGLAFGLLRPRFPRVMQRLTLVLDREIDDGRGPAERRGGRARLEIVGGRRAAERHVEMRVHVDAAGQDVLAVRVDRLVRGHVERCPDQRDLLVFDEDVALVLIDRGDDGAVLDESSHVLGARQDGSKAGRQKVKG